MGRHHPLLSWIALLSLCMCGLITSLGAGRDAQQQYHGHEQEICGTVRTLTHSG